MPRTVLVAAIVAAAAAAAPPASAEWVMAERLPGRETDVLSAHAADHADLLMRALDSNSDWRLDASGADLSPEAVRQHLPGVEVSQFASFLQLADADRDGKVDRPELARALATGFAGAGNTELLQIDEQNRGFFDTIKNFGKAVLGNVKNKINIAGNRILGKVDVTQDACVMCQYIVERLETNVRQSGVIPNMPTGDVPLYVSTSNDNPFSPYAPRPPAGHGGSRGGHSEGSESSARVAASTTGTTGTTTNADGTAPTDKVSLLEVEAKTEAKDPYDAAGAGIIAASRESTRMQRQMERQKYNEIYRVVDITLDDVCEQGMPAPFYGYCKQIYQVQSDIVDGLRYQYRPADICFRVGMCGKESYITKGIHSRYQA